MIQLIVVRKIDDGSEAEIQLVAERMRSTLIEVLGPERGGSMYTLDWLIQRVKFHLDQDLCDGAVFLALGPDEQIAGHTIVRLEAQGGGGFIGLFSTTYIHPPYRRQGVAKALLDQGEAWMREKGMKEAVTYTDSANEPLQKLFMLRGYRCEPLPNDFVALSKTL